MQIGNHTSILSIDLNPPTKKLYRAKESRDPSTYKHCVQ